MRFWAEPKDSKIEISFVLFSPFSFIYTTTKYHNSFNSQRFYAKRIALRRAQRLVFIKLEKSYFPSIKMDFDNKIQLQPILCKMKKMTY